MSDASGTGQVGEPRAARRRRRRTKSRRHGSQFTGRNLLALCGFLAASLAALYFLLPQLAGLQDTWHRIEDGSPWWMLLALAFTLGMFAGYVTMFRGVFVRAERASRSAGARATRSRWPAWRPRGSSPPAAPAGWC